MCCDCRKKVKNVATQIWVEDEVIVEKLNRLAVSHGYCDECLEVAMEEIRDAHKKSHPEKWGGFSLTFLTWGIYYLFLAVIPHTICRDQGFPLR